MSIQVVRVSNVVVTLGKIRGKVGEKWRWNFCLACHIKHSGKDAFCRGTLRLKRTQKH